MITVTFLHLCCSFFFGQGILSDITCTRHAVTFTCYKSCISQKASNAQVCEQVSHSERKPANLCAPTCAQALLNLITVVVYFSFDERVYHVREWEDLSVNWVPR